jgi:hypothetical protein
MLVDNELENHITKLREQTALLICRFGWCGHSCVAAGTARTTEVFEEPPVLSFGCSGGDGMWWGFDVYWW